MRPKLCALALGSLAAYQARLDFSANLFGAAGIELVVCELAELDDPARVTAEVERLFGESGCAAAIVCGRDPDYAAIAPTLVPALTSAGAARVWIAGRPPEPDAWGSGFAVVHLGCDALAACEQALRAVAVITDSTDAPAEIGEER